jgi:hypothetical protein
MEDTNQLVCVRNVLRVTPTVTIIADEIWPYSYTNFMNNLAAAGGALCGQWGCSCDGYYHWRGQRTPHTDAWFMLNCSYQNKYY